MKLNFNLTPSLLFLKHKNTIIFENLLYNERQILNLNLQCNGYNIASGKVIQFIFALLSHYLNTKTNLRLWLPNKIVNR